MPKLLAGEVEIWKHFFYTPVFASSWLPHFLPSLFSFLRFHTMTIMIAVDILGCTGSMEERASLLHKTIQLAAELKSTMGNMFSFAAVMDALEMTQVLVWPLPCPCPQLAFLLISGIPCSPSAN